MSASMASCAFLPCPIKIVGRAHSPIRVNSIRMTRLISISIKAKHTQAVSHQSLDAFQRVTATKLMSRSAMAPTVHKTSLNSSQKGRLLT